MEQHLFCPYCKAEVDFQDTFCKQCGKNLKQKNLSTSLGTEITVYLVSFLLAPFGIVWGLKYFKENNPRARRIAWGSVIVTAIALLIGFWAVASYLSELKQQLLMYQGLGI